MIIKAQLAGASVILELDANSKLGPELIPGDPHMQTANGSFLAGIISRQNLIIGNSMACAVGLITRQRTTINGEEKSVIDFMLFSSDILENIKSVQIDEKKDYSLTRFGTENGKSVVKESDHNPIIGKLRLHVKNVKKERVEMFNLRNTECQKQFKEVTDKTDLLSTSIREDENIEVSFERFLLTVHHFM